jgi:ribose transport system permease protein
MLRKFNVERLQQLSIAALLALLVTISIVKSRNVPVWASNLLTDAAVVGVITIGMTFVMVAGGFDLSVGSIAAVCGCVAVLALKAMPAQAPTSVALASAFGLTLVCGLILGAINGVFIAYLGVNPFVVTLSMMFVFRGIGLVLTGGGQSQVVPMQHSEAFRLIYWKAFRLLGLKISVPVLIFLALFAAGVYLLRFTRFGHHVYATGGNERAAWLAGINTRAVSAITYILSGVACAVAALIWTGLSTTAQASDYAGKEMIVIAAVIVGGTPLGGGRGGLFTTLGGLLLLCALDQLLTQFGVDPQYRQIMTGLIILAAVTLDTYFKKWRTR